MATWGISTLFSVNVPSYIATLATPPFEQIGRQTVDLFVRQKTRLHKIQKRKTHTNTNHKLNERHTSIFGGPLFRQSVSCNDRWPLIEFFAKWLTKKGKKLASKRCLKKQNYFFKNVRHKNQIEAKDFKKRLFFLLF